MGTEFMKYAHAAADTNPNPAFRKLKEIKEAFKLKYKDGVVVAYSGGVDSSLVAKLAKDTLETRTVAVTADAESLPGTELEAAKEVAQRIGIRHVIKAHSELANTNYVANTALRCYFCKGELSRVLEATAKELGFKIIADGINYSDLGEHRPGMEAMNQAGVWHPLLEFKVTKDEVRQMAKFFGLPNWDKPAQACLSSRIPHGSPVTEEKLRQVERAESGLLGLGFTSVRVRHYDTVARIELPPAEIERLLAPGSREKAVAAVKAAGFQFVALDLEGYRPGSMEPAAPLLRPS